MRNLTRNSSGVEFKSHIGVWRGRVLASFRLPFPPLTPTDDIFPSEAASSRAPSLSWLSKENLKAHSDVYLEGGICTCLSDKSEAKLEV